MDGLFFRRGGAQVPGSIRNTQGQVLTLSQGTRVDLAPRFAARMAGLFCLVCGLARYLGKLARCDEQTHAHGHRSARLRRLTFSQIADEALKFLVAQQELATGRDQFVDLRLL